MPKGQCQTKSSIGFLAEIFERNIDDFDQRFGHSSSLFCHHWLSCVDPIHRYERENKIQHCILLEGDHLSLFTVRFLHSILSFVISWFRFPLKPFPSAVTTNELCSNEETR